jgi:hypothetical protein
MTSREHVPPRAFFRGFSVIPITVPSCDKHNLSKSNDDQAMLSVFGHSLNIVRTKVQISNNMQLGMSRAEKAFAHTRKLSYRNTTLVDINIPTLLQTAFIAIDIKPWIRALTAGIYWSATEHFDPTITWDGIDCWSPEWVDIPLDYRLDRTRFLKFARQRGIRIDYMDRYFWSEGWSPYPKDVYHFQVGGIDNELVIRHVFFRDYRWFAHIPVRENAISAIWDKMKTQA